MDQVIESVTKLVEKKEAALKSKATVLINLYYLLVSADGVVNKKEIAIGKTLSRLEQIEKDFESIYESASWSDRERLYSECIDVLRNMDVTTRLRYVAWLSLVANIDGFMDKREWQFIYKLYKTDLSLELSEVMKVQKELNKAVLNEGLKKSF